MRYFLTPDHIYNRPVKEKMISDKTGSLLNVLIGITDVSDHQISPLSKFNRLFTGVTKRVFIKPRILGVDFGNTLDQSFGIGPWAFKPVRLLIYELLAVVDGGQI